MYSFPVPLVFWKREVYNKSIPYDDVLPKGSMLFKKITSHNVDFAKLSVRERNANLWQSIGRSHLPFYRGF